MNTKEENSDFLREIKDAFHIQKGYQLIVNVIGLVIVRKSLQFMDFTQFNSFRKLTEIDPIVMFMRSLFNN